MQRSVFVLLLLDGVAHPVLAACSHRRQARVVGNARPDAEYIGAQVAETPAHKEAGV